MTDQATIEEIEDMHTMFWLDRPIILIEHPAEFYPSQNMNLAEKLNSIIRLSIYSGVVLSLITANYMYLYVPVVIAAFTVFIWKMQRKNVEKFFQEYERMGLENGKPCVLPSTENPFMNWNQITGDRFAPPACQTYDNQGLQEDVDQKFNYNLYRDVGDLYGKNNSQREFYTVPVTTAASNQTSFAKWLYNTGATCKEDSVKCAPETDFSAQISSSPTFGQYVNN